MVSACSTSLLTHFKPDAWLPTRARTCTSKGDFSATAYPWPPLLPVPSWSPPPRPVPVASTLLLPTLVPPPLQAMPRWLDFSFAPSPRVLIEPWQPLPLLPLVLLARKPISHCTHSCSPAPLVLFTPGQPFHKCVTYQIPTAKSDKSPVKPI
jgi:hypothetical protein